MTSTPIPAWQARGLLFENCPCQLVCPGHMHFDQLCTHERCLGFWAIRIDEGRYGEVPLAGVKVVIAFDAPQHMIDGHWTEVLIVDSETTPGQRAAVETILTGRAGGPWAKLAPFVEHWLPTRVMPIAFSEDGDSKRGVIAGLWEAVVTPIRGRDRSKPVTFENIFNQIHAPTQVIAQSTSTYDDGTIRWDNKGTHGLYSNFEWIVDPSRPRG